jgi:methylglutaconyl-CoA hydratase
MEFPSYNTISVSRVEDLKGIRVELNRPDVRNCFNAEMITELTDAFTKINESDPYDVRVAILCGAGTVFCAGADINWMRSSVDKTEDENIEDARRMAHMYQTIDSCSVPVIARVQKACFGGGLGLICACDIVVAEAETRMSFSEVRLGIIPAVISSFAMAKIGRSNARRYFLTGEVFTAEKAPFGLIHEVVSTQGLDPTVEELASDIISNGPEAVRLAKKLIPAVRARKREEAIEYCAKTIAGIRTGDEAQEGLGAFLEKRNPSWIDNG